MKKAFIHKVLNGRQTVYRLSEPMTDWRGKECEYVILSTNRMETYIFPSNKMGDIVSFSEMNGSEKGQRSHRAILLSCGYELEE